MYRLNFYMLPNNHKEPSKKSNDKKIPKDNENRNKHTKIYMDVAKSVLREKFIATPA